VGARCCNRRAGACSACGNPLGRPRIGAEHTAFCARGGAARALAAAVRPHTRGRHRQSAARACHGVRSAGWLTDAGLERRGFARARSCRAKRAWCVRASRLYLKMCPSRQPDADLVPVRTQASARASPAQVCCRRGSCAECPCAHWTASAPLHLVQDCSQATTSQAYTGADERGAAWYHAMSGSEQPAGTSRPRSRCCGRTPSRAHALAHPGALAMRQRIRSPAG